MGETSAGSRGEGRKLLSIKQPCELLGLSRSTGNEWAQAGTFPGLVKLDGHRMPVRPAGADRVCVAMLRARVTDYQVGGGPKRVGTITLREQLDPQTWQQAFFSTNRTETIRGISSPLGFCALALLIVEGFLFGAGAVFPLNEDVRLVLIFIGVALFLVVFATVIFLVVQHPEKLVFTERSHLAAAAMRYGSKELPMSENELRALPAAEAPSPLAVLPAPHQR
jgi:hypothetical protein